MAKWTKRETVVKEIHLHWFILIIYILNVSKFSLMQNDSEKSDMEVWSLVTLSILKSSCLNLLKMTQTNENRHRKYPKGFQQRRVMQRCAVEMSFAKSHKSGSLFGKYRFPSIYWCIWAQHNITSKTKRKVTKYFLLLHAKAEHKDTHWLWNKRLQIAPICFNACTICSTYTPVPHLQHVSDDV